MKYGVSKEVYEKIKLVLEKNKKYKILLFGSRARGDYKETSDIDLAVLSEISRDEQYKFMNEIDLLDIVYKIDIVFVDSNTKEELVESIKRDGVEF